MTREKWHIETSHLTPGGTLWTNLGAWPVRQHLVASDGISQASSDTADVTGEGTPLPYAKACENLATHIGQAAGLRPGMRILDVACGYGASISHWVDHFGVARVDVLDIRASCVEAIQHRNPVGLGVTWVGSANQLPSLATPKGPFGRHAYDAVVCLDAAYHFANPLAFFKGAATLLVPGGRIAWTSFAPKDATNRRSLPLGTKLALNLATIPSSALLSHDAVRDTLSKAALTLDTYQILDAEVLAGFAAHVKRLSQSLSFAEKSSSHWWKIRATASLAERIYSSQCLHYALFGARL